MPVIILFLIMVGLIVGVFWVIDQEEEASNLPDFPISKFTKNPLNYSGNKYLLEGEVLARLAYKKEIGHIVTFKTESVEDRIPVFITTEKAEGLYVGQRYRLTISIDEKGNVYADSLQKY